MKVNENLFAVTYESRFGTLQLWSNATGLTRLLLPSEVNGEETCASGYQSGPILDETCRQLDSYFTGELPEFDLPLAPELGTEFQRRVWNELTRIPIGTTISYAQLAARVGRPRAVRAVGAANGRNPLPIIVPCHRAIGANGSLTGYAGGVELKRQLLDHEARCGAIV